MKFTINLAGLFKIISAGFLGWALITGRIEVMNTFVGESTDKLAIHDSWRLVWVTR
jgi:hypothetical protein